jgi:Kef-type K+ transport system membrane component KefB
MENVWVLASVWVGLALVATLLGIWFRISTALTEIVVGTVAQLIVGVFIVKTGVGGTAPWITFLAGAGAIVLTFLAGAELDPTLAPALTPQQLRCDRARYSHSDSVTFFGVTLDPYAGKSAMKHGRRRQNF